MLMERDALIDWIYEIDPNLYLTHNFGYRASFETREKSLKEFYNRAQRQVYGRNWHKRHTDEPMVAIGIWEHLESNVHCHVLVSASSKETTWLKANGADLWRALQPRGQLDISGKIASISKVARYNTKELYAPDSLDQMFLYNAPKGGCV